MSVDHYENFPVASWLCPPRLRPAVAAIYWFARTADDLADEGDQPAAERLADLAAYRADLLETAAGRPASGRWPRVFGALGPVLARHGLPVEPFTDLLSAFEQDLVKTNYESRAELLDYCRRSANPIGRLLLKLYGVADAGALAQSDAVCSALQLINFWQDVSIDVARGRLYLPLEDCAAHRLAPESALAGQDSPALRQALQALCAWAHDLMRSGAPLVHRLPGRTGWELRLVVQGGLRILEKIARMEFQTMKHRPTLTPWDAPLMMWRAARMRGASGADGSLGARPTAK